MSQQGCCIQGNFPMQVTQGDNLVPYTFTLSKKSTCAPLDLSAASEITTNYKNADGTTVLQHKLSLAQIVLISGPGGVFQDTLTAAETAALNPGNGDIILTYTIGGITKELVLYGAIVVTSPPFVIP